jgi:hypothetical protein
MAVARRNGLVAPHPAEHAPEKRTRTSVGEYVKVESGKKNQRPQLLAAIAAVRQAGGVLLSAKLDRLSRNAGVILALRDSGYSSPAAICLTPIRSR